MAVDSVWAEPLSPTLVRIHFTSTLTSPTFYVWVDGELFGQTQAAYMDVPAGIAQVAQVDIFDDAGDAPTAVYPATLTLTWEVGDYTAISRIEQWDGADWNVVAQVPATGAGMGSWESPPLADGETHTFRVVPVDAEARDGVPREFSGVMCRWPDAPSFTVAVDSGEFTLT